MIDAALLAKGETLATVDDITYRAVRLVFACDANEAPSLYCALDDWPTTHAAKLAAKDRAIAELETVLSQQAAESLKQSQRAGAAEARVKDLEARLVKAQPAPIVCPECDKGGWKSTRSLQMHRQRVHDGMQAVRAVAPPLQLVEELGWRCAAKGCSGAHARDLHDPAFCTLHATRSANGHEIAAS